MNNQKRFLKVEVERDFRRMEYKYRENKTRGLYHKRECIHKDLEMENKAMGEVLYSACL